MATNIVITGASSEIGMAICRKFDHPDHHLLLQCFSNKQKLENFTAELKANTTVVACDLSEAEEVTAFLSRLRDISILINAAAVTRTDLLVNITDPDIKKMLDVNIYATVRICRAVIPQMLVKRKGIIINISSVAASKGNRGQTVYAGTKGFIESFSKSLASEVGIKGIRVNCIAPGVIEAGSVKELLALAPDELKKGIALNRFGKPSDIASMVHYLCSDDAAYITGQIFRVDGGFQLGI